ncbi:MAG: prohead protease [Gallionellales bacterium RIFCSPLOWO2_12_FULL_59_22]|nr:MAG: prohead protease [Gallionellales bacterium RIFCSPLOWO2_02_FULL_59_110]OGT03485.1 MAG: prohead protease [Gallionellales bacterium RIFCSPLOWO2_02_58_13]OGT13362.1 MAG: prohead protease [Gallionellales bacterium RIFCSPLOWO2_12_FULL_59_22]
MTTIHSSQLSFFARHAPFDRMEREHLLWMLERMQLAYYAKGEVIASPQQGEATRFFVIKQGLVRGARIANTPQDAVLELHEGECFPVGALLGRRAVTSEYRAEEDAFCFELPALQFRELIELSVVFKDFCTRRIAALFEQSTQAMQAQLSHASTEQQSLSSTLESIIRRAPVACCPDTTIRSALQQMRDAHLGSMIVTDAAQRPLGIFTLRDLLERVVLADLPIDQPIGNAMSSQPVTLPPGALAYEAAMVMARKGFRHVLVTEQDGTLRGIVSERDLFSLQRVGLRQLSTSLRQADSSATLISLGKDIRELTHNMMAQGVAAEQITLLISTLNDLLTSRIIELECIAAGLQHENADQPELCWLALGSEGRLEQTFYTDQDNGIIFNVPEGGTADAVRQRLLPVAKRINEALAECGFPLCGGGIMASNSKWCLSREEWQKTFAEWIDHGSPEDLLNASIFFDFRSLYGNASFAAALRGWLNKKISGTPRFLHQMAANALRNRPPLGVIRDFVVGQQQTLDIKLNGTTPFVDAARILGLACGSSATNTVQRLREIAGPLHIGTAEIEGWIEAFYFLQTMRLLHQYECSARGAAMNNHVNPEQLNDLDRRILKEAFRQSRKMQSRLTMEYRL